MANRLKICGIVVLFGSFCLAGVNAASVSLLTQDKDILDLPQRLNRLDQILEQKRQKFFIPGMAIAIVKNDKVIYSKGFGWADLENKEPVTPNHIFAIGSASKAFTSALIGMIVDEGKMDWDDPVQQYLPYFSMKPKSSDPQAKVTIRDCLTHRSGFIRTNMIWLMSGLSREDVLKKANDAVPWLEFRKNFLYTNIMYMAAGVAAAAAGDSDWDRLVQERIFKPLDMANSFTSMEDLPTEKLALGYIWDDVLEKNFRNPRRNMDNVGPAGSINSTVLDMARWIILHLKRGKIGDKELLSEESHDEIWRKQFEIGGGQSYGFGWFLREWKGKPAVEHGGGIDGFSAQVTMLPESNMGFVLLTNLTSSPFPASAADVVFGTLLDTAAAPVQKTGPVKKLVPEDTDNQSREQLLDKILTLRKSGERKAALQDMGIIRLKGKASIPHSGIKGTFSWTIDGADRFCQTQDYGPFGYLGLAVDGERGQKMTYWLPMVELYGHYLEQGRQANLLAVVGEWRDFYKDIRFLREEKRGTETIYRLQMIGSQTPPVTYLVDSETCDVLSSGTPILRLGSASRMPEAAIYEDYREFGGLRFPSRITYSNNYIGQIILEIEEIETRIDDTGIAFSLPGTPINKVK